MISLESKTQATATSSPLNLAPKEEGPEIGLSFSELLRGVSTKKDDKIIQNGAFVVALDGEVSADTKASSTKTTSLLELLKGEQKEASKLPLELNPEAIKDLTPKEIKVLIKDAKEYLKNKIISSEGFKKAEIANLPKTLKGLVQVAQKFGIDIGKITLQEVKQSTLAQSQPIQTITPLKEDTYEIKSKVQVRTAVRDSLEVDAEVISKQVPKNVPVSLKTSDVPEKLINEKLSQQVKADVKIDTKVAVQAEKLIKEIKATPLFKAQSVKEITTEQLVNTKISTLEVNVPKKKTDETLKLLLRGETVAKADKGFTSDFSVATARVLAPEATRDVNKSLESLLRGETKDSTQNQKLDGLNIAKADSFEIKLNEAKQMTKYLSGDVKTAIEDYKSPFTRIKVALNPQRLGSIELTVVQRGKNLHINISSNNAAINALVLNANDLKVQLSNSGINNATLNFNNNSSSSEQGSFGQQQRNSQNERQAKEEYNYFTNEETNEEILNSLEIVVPHYA
ncbi:Flagellar hook-length control protein FliK [hydrothermal vent metagenome]|uniref:Flagellar hook-length control protein FliK n=1 Tax=hydrothermal vent metagenome TaxID=652676 RepID=A0A1W1BK16_9ZZZZ